jgi:hypothetical protein
VIVSPEKSRLSREGTLSVQGLKETRLRLLVRKVTNGLLGILNRGSFLFLMEGKGGANQKEVDVTHICVA